MIRAATQADLPALLELGARMHAESPHFSRITFSPERLAGTLQQVLDSPGGFLAVAEVEGKLAGVFVAIAMQHWCSEDIVTSDLALFVEPEHRGTMLAVRLIRCYLAWARDTGAKIIGAGISTGVFVEETARLYEAMGMKRYGVLLEA